MNLAYLAASNPIYHDFFMLKRISKIVRDKLERIAFAIFLKLSN
jgi:hypothetical protein